MPLPSKPQPLARLLACTALAVAAQLSHAADYAPTAPADKLAGVRTQIAAKQWSEAIDELKRIADAGSADWNNLMGYSLRKQATPDLDGAERHYDAALRIDPQHRGALEYSGELYLMKGDVGKAEARLAALDKACFLPCREYSDLKAALQRHKGSASAQAR